ncbi:MAG: MogA/MoaB family molybdenum cofactor biosynthesis protein [Nitrospirae bacterium]|nr:MogA/MoaB family molybdenum cofactor biosynthesis protein [Nitrospirota bacterium]
MVLEVSVIVISSKILSGKNPDTGREGLEKLLALEDAKILNYQVVSDEREEIKNALLATIHTQHPHVVLTVGGTGVRPTDWAPEATRDVIDKEIPGIGEAMRLESLKKVRTAMLSRGTAGIKNSTLIVNLPGSAKGAQENLGVLLPILEHTVEKISKTAPVTKG